MIQSPARCCTHYSYFTPFDPGYTPEGCGSVRVIIHLKDGFDKLSLTTYFNSMGH